MSKQKPLTKITEFEGYLSGDGECFCLSKLSSKELEKLNDMSKLSMRGITRRLNHVSSSQLYPNKFFPEEAQNKKCKFKITVETIIIEDTLFI